MKHSDKIPVVGAVMTSFPYFVEAHETLLAVEKMMDAHDIRHLPVQENGKLVGIVSERDLHHRVARSASIEAKQQLSARDVMVADPYVVGFSTPLNEVVAAMAQQHIGSAIVVRRGRLAGILSAIDVCRIFAEYLDARSPSGGNEAA